MRVGDMYVSNNTGAAAQRGFEKIEFNAPYVSILRRMNRIAMRRSHKQSFVSVRCSIQCLLDPTPLLRMGAQVRR